MATVTDRPLETGWLPDTPVGDTLLRRFVHNQGELNGATAVACGGRASVTDDVFLADSGGPVPYLNQAILRRPVIDPDDPALDEVEAFFDSTGRPCTMLSIWPTPDLSHRGWTLYGHPALVVRSPGPVDHRPPADVGVKVATEPDDFTTAARVAVEGYPMPGAGELDKVIPPSVAGLVVRLGLLDGAPVAIGNCHVAHGVVNLCLGATLAAARRRGVWEALVWARIADGPDLPAVAYTSDHSRPGFLRMGFLPLTRFTLWGR